MENASQSNKGKRPYHSRVRQRHAEEKHQRILVATRELFASIGYAGTTLEAIAEVAEVSPKTVSAVFGSKRAILAEVVNPGAFGPHILKLLDELRATPEPSRQLSLVAQITRQAYEPLVLELELLRTAHAVAPELTDLAWEIEMRRRQNQSRLVAYLDEHRKLRQGLPLEEATDVLWTLTSYELYRMLVIERLWPPERYETWLAQLLIQHLLQPVEDGPINQIE
jgi:AcrR family transcriptional regulator